MNINNDLSSTSGKNDDRAFSNWGMDSTAVEKFTIVDNTKYSDEIINEARASYDPEKLSTLKMNTDLTEFYDEGKGQILAQWHADQALTIHSDMFRVQFQINIGNILNEIEPTFKKKSEYIEWLKNNFENKHMRYFQQARQLADMGDFARLYAAAGKNRLLALERLRKVEHKRECLALFDNYPLPDTDDDGEGELLKRQIDSVITLHRLHNDGVRFATFDQAAQIASFNLEAIGVKQSGEISNWLNQQPEEERPALFSRYIQDGMTYPPNDPYVPPLKKISLDKILADLLSCYGPANLEDDGWIAKQRELKLRNSLLRAQQFIAQLIDRIGTDEQTTEVTTETAE